MRRIGSSRWEWVVMHTSIATTRHWALLLGAFVILLAGPAPADDADVQALFITKVALYVEWPADAFADPDAPIVIGILDDEQLATALGAAVIDTKAKGRSFEVRPLAAVEEADTCHIVVLGSNRRYDLRRTARELRGKSILTIASSPNFAKDGGILSMEMHRGKVAFEVNNRTAKKSDIKISSRLLRLASNVH
jgi:hypothetical protein